jgi:TatD DNase family protein
MHVPTVDTHCHLNHHEGLTPDEQIRRAADAGVCLMVDVGTDLESSQNAVLSAARYRGVFAAVAIHPNHADEATAEVLAAIEELAQDPGCVAIGETGLDYYRDFVAKDVQHASFKAHIAIAKKYDRTLMIHCREAWDDCLNVLEEVGAPKRVVMHCYSGDRATTARCITAGYFMSFAGNVTFTNADALRDVVTMIPDGLLLTETDAPFLAPHPHRGQPNDSSFVPLTAARIAAVKQADLAKMATQIRDNTRRAFALPDDAGSVVVGIRDSATTESTASR